LHCIAKLNHIKWALTNNTASTAAAFTVQSHTSSPNYGLVNTIAISDRTQCIIKSQENIYNNI